MLTTLSYEPGEDLIQFVSRYLLGVVPDATVDDIAVPQTFEKLSNRLLHNLSEMF